MSDETKDPEVERIVCDVMAEIHRKWGWTAGQDILRRAVEAGRAPLLKSLAEARDHWRCDNAITDAKAEGAREEREACAEVAEEAPTHEWQGRSVAKAIADGIRARGGGR